MIPAKQKSVRVPMDAATLAELRRRLKDRNAPGYWGVNARAWAKKILREHKNPGGRDSRIRYKSPPLKPCHHCRHKFAGSICPICKTERTDYAALRKNPRDPLHTITASDVGRVTITARGKRWNIVDVMGPIQRIDIGKRIYDMGDGVLQVENDAQRDARLGVRQNPRQDVAFADTTLNVWEERDRLHIALVDTKTEQKTFAEWWDDDAREMFEDGFFERGKRLHQSVFDYAKEHGLLTPMRAKKNPRGTMRLTPNPRAPVEWTGEYPSNVVHHAPFQVQFRRLGRWRVWEDFTTLQFAQTEARKVADELNMKTRVIKL